MVNYFVEEVLFKIVFLKNIKRREINSENINSTVDVYFKTVFRNVTPDEEINSPGNCFRLRRLVPQPVFGET